MNPLDYFVRLLPAKWQPYGKAIAVGLIATLSVAVGVAGAPAWVAVALNVLSTPVVFGTPNIQQGDGDYPA